MFKKAFKELPILGILRGVGRLAIAPIIDEAAQAGLRAIEITMNTPGAPDIIREAVKYKPRSISLGAGTVLSLNDLSNALGAGAEFIVMPVLVREVAEFCAKKNVPFFPGALTPQEIFEVWHSGAYMVKVFPAKLFGPDYFKEIKGPFDKVELMACAGVTPENLADYFRAGASAVSFGASVFRKDWMDDGAFDKIGILIKSYINSYNQMKGR